MGNYESQKAQNRDSRRTCGTSICRSEVCSRVGPVLEYRKAVSFCADRAVAERGSGQTRQAELLRGQVRGQSISRKRFARRNMCTPIRLLHGLPTTTL